MSYDPNTAFDLNVLTMIEASAVGAVPSTPSYQQALRRLRAAHQVYPSAEFPDGHVTARSLANAPRFYAGNLEQLIQGAIEANALEGNTSIFDRYVASLPAAQQDAANGYRLKIAGRLVHHRKHHGTDAPHAHDPLHSLFLVPGTGTQHGLPGNYLHGLICEVPHPDGHATWSVRLQDAADGTATYEAATLPEAWEKLQETVVSAPFDLSELAALGFKAN